MRKIVSLQNLVDKTRPLLEEIIEFYKIENFKFNLLTSQLINIEHKLLEAGIPNHIIKQIVTLFVNCQNVANAKIKIDVAAQQLKTTKKRLGNQLLKTQVKQQLNFAEEQNNEIIRELEQFERNENNQSAISQACEIVNNWKKNSENKDNTENDIWNDDWTF